MKVTYSKTFDAERLGLYYPQVGPLAITPRIWPPAYENVVCAHVLGEVMLTPV